MEDHPHVLLIQVHIIWLDLLLTSDKLFARALRALTTAIPFRVVIVLIGNKIQPKFCTQTENLLSLLSFYDNQLQ